MSESADADAGGRPLIGRVEQYEIEKELAARLRSAPQAERRSLYNAVYDELFERAPRHRRASQAGDAGHDDVAAQVRLLHRFVRPGSVFMEIGPGDYRVVGEIARTAAKVYAVDVALERARRAQLPGNVELCLSDGITIPVPPGSVALAYSNQVMEHLHPDDAGEQLRNIHRALDRTGRYVCVTPNRLSGPHDISRYFDDVASGLHLKEYSVTELAGAFRTAGFSRVQALVSYRGRVLAPLLPVSPIRTFESLLEALPKAMRRNAARGLVAVKIVGTK